MGAVPAQALACGIWSPPDVTGVRGFSGKRPWRVRQPMTILNKTDLRKNLRSHRKDFVSKRENSNFLETVEGADFLRRLLKPDAVVAGYCAMGSEADIAGLMQRIADQGARLALPWLATRSTPMLFRAWQPGAPLEMSASGFTQPLPTAIATSPTIILLPLVGFDRTGNRLGQGAGHYDRALEHLPSALRVGIAWSVQEVDQLPADPWDAPLDAVLTEREWIKTPNSRI